MKYTAEREKYTVFRIINQIPVPVFKDALPELTYGAAQLFSWEALNLIDFKSHPIYDPLCGSGARELHTLCIVSAERCLLFVLTQRAI